MKIMTIENRRKLFNVTTSIPVASVLYGLPFGLLMTAAGKGPFSWTLFMAMSVFFGVTMAVLMKRKLNKMPGMARTDEDWVLLGYFKKGSLPTDPILLRLYPDYIDRTDLQIVQSRKAMPLMAIIGLVSLLYWYGARNVVLGLIGLFILAMTVYSFFSIRGTTQKIAKLRRQLKSSKSKRAPSR